MERKILFVIDMQNDFIDGALGSKDAQRIVPNVVKLIKTFDQDQQIWYTKDTHYDSGDLPYEPKYEDTLEGKMLPIKHCIKSTEGWKLNSEVMNALDQYHGTTTAVYKNTFGSLSMIKDASMYLWDNVDSKEEIIICGLCTDICVISNALLLRAQFPNLKITCYSNCCAGTSPEAHNAALTIMKSCQINVKEL